MNANQISSHLEKAISFLQKKAGQTLSAVVFTLGFVGLFGCKSSSPAVQLVSVRPIDARLTVASSKFKRVEEGTWATDEIKSPFAFEELIYSWHSRLAPGEGFRIYLRAKAEDGQYSPWLYGGYWGKVKNLQKRKVPVFEWGTVDMDHMQLKRKASTFQFKVVDEGDCRLKNAPSLSVVVTDNSPAPGLVKRFTVASDKRASTTILDLPFRRQADSKGNPLPSRCQSAALATAMEYFNKPIGLEDIVPLTYDEEYEFPGVWPRTIGAGIQHGFEGYIDRFRDWDYVRKTVAENKVILCSIRMPAGPGYKAPPYNQIGGHIVALNGVTEDGRVIVTDSAVTKENRGYCLQWLKEDFEKVWMQTKGGVGMVICPPKNARVKLVDNLPPFPVERYR